MFSGLDDRERLAALLVKFLDLPTMGQSQQLLQNHPELLGPEAIQLLGRWVQFERKMGHDEEADNIELHLSLSLLSQEIGIEQAFSQYFQFVRANSVSDEFRGAVEDAHAAFSRFLQRGYDCTDLDIALTSREKVIRHPRFKKGPTFAVVDILNEAGNAYFQRYKARGQREDLDRSRRCYEEAATAPDLERQGVSTGVFVGLARALHARFELDGDGTALEQAIKAGESALRSAQPGSAGLHMVRNNLAVYLRARFTLKGDRADLDRSVGLYREAIDAVPQGSSDLPMFYSNQGNALRMIYEGTGKLKDLQASIDASERAVQAVPPGRDPAPESLMSLANGLKDLALLTGQEGDLDRALVFYRRALEKSPAGSTLRPLVLSNLGIALRHRYSRTGAFADLRTAIAHMKEAVALTSPSSPYLAGYLSNLGGALNESVESEGNVHDSERAIEVLERALALPGVASILRALCLSNLGSSVLNRFRRTGALDDIEWAIRLHSQSVDETPAGSPELPGRLGNLGNGLRERSQRTGSLDDLDKAVSAYERALSVTPDPSDELLPAVLDNLGSGLRDRFLRRGSLKDLLRAIEVQEKSLALTAPGHSRRETRMNNLANAFKERYTTLGDPKDLDRAITLYDGAVESLPPGSQSLPMFLNNLGAGYADRARRGGAADDLQRGIAAFRRGAVECGDLDLDETLRCARNWALWAFERESWDEVVEASRRALYLGEQLTLVQLTRNSRETSLRGVQGLVSRAAYALAKTGDPEGAVTILDHGRARLLSEALSRDQADLDSLRRDHSDVYSRYHDAAERLAGVLRKRPEARATTGWRNPATQARKAHAALDTAIEAVRGVTGHENFLRHPGLEGVLKAVASLGSRHALVYLIVSPAGSLALIVSRQVEDLWIDFKQDQLDSLLLKQDGSEPPRGYMVGQFSNPSLLPEALREVLPLLGERLMDPLAVRLAELDIEAVTLVPTGRLALMPLHACLISDFRKVDAATAGGPRVPSPLSAIGHRPVNDADTDQSSEQKVHFLDRFRVSYIPNAHALGAALQSVRRRAAPDLLIGAGNPLPNPRPLLAAEAELIGIAACFPEGACRSFFREKATRVALLSVIPDAGYLHLACHGIFDPSNPLDSHLELSGSDRLTLGELLDGEARPLNARLAVLSACQSAVSDFRFLPDETIGLPFGMLQAGVPGVVGTLWPVDDLATALLMIRFYSFHRHGDPASGRGPVEPPEALRQAQRWLRDVTNDELVRDFESYKRHAARSDASRPGMPLEMILQGLARFSLDDPMRQPFADQPFFWAAFLIQGV